jgi:hypothetical protein
MENILIMLNVKNILIKWKKVSLLGIWEKFRNSILIKKREELEGNEVTLW